MSAFRLENGVAIPLTQEEIDAQAAKEAAWVASQAARDAQAARIDADSAEVVSCAGDGAIMSLINQTRAEWQTWAGANFPTLTTAEKNRLGTLFWVVAVGVRRNLR